KILKTMEYHKVIHKLSAHAATSLGKERCEQLQPSGEIDEVKHRLQLTDEAVDILRLKGSAPFGGIRNVRSSVQRARIAGMLNAMELMEIAGTLEGGRKLKAFLEQVDEDRPIPGLRVLFDQLTDHKAVEKAITHCIDDNGDVLDQASSELSRIRSEIRTNESRARDKLESMIRSSSTQKMLQDQLITLRNDRYVIPVKQEYRSHFGGIVHDQSASGATLFIEPEAVVTINNKLRELRLNEEKEIEKILRALTEKVAE